MIALNNSSTTPVDGVGEMWFFSVCPAGSIDCTYVTHVDFWFYTDNVNIFKSARDCAFDLSYTGAWSSGGVRVNAGTLPALTLEKGWNHLTLPWIFQTKPPNVTSPKLGDFAFIPLVLTTWNSKYAWMNFVL